MSICLYLELHIYYRCDRQCCDYITTKHVAPYKPKYGHEGSCAQEGRQIKILDCVCGRGNEILHRSLDSKSQFLSLGLKIQANMFIQSNIFILKYRHAIELCQFILYIYINKCPKPVNTLFLITKSMPNFHVMFGL